MPARPYVPSGKSEPGALATLLLGAAAVAIGAGLVEALVSRWFSLLIVFPALIGLCAGGFAHWRVGRAKVRAPLLAGMLAGIAGATGQVAVHAGEYLTFRQEMLSKIDAPDAGEQLDAFLEQKTGSRGFVGFVQLRAELGTTITRAGHSGDDGPTISGVGSYVLWLVEILIAGGVAAGMAAGRARKPFCERCKKWYDAALPVASGSADGKAIEAVIRGIELHDMRGAIAARGEPGANIQSTLLVAECSSCELAEPVLTVQVTAKVKNRSKTAIKYRSLIRRDEARELRQAASAGAEAVQSAPSHA